MTLNVLVLSRIYPNNVLPLSGLWVEGLTSALRRLCEVRVVSPVPYCPPVPNGVSYGRYRQIPRRDRVSGIEVSDPRFLTGPARTLDPIEAASYYWGVRGDIARLRRDFPFDVIHAHFAYPDGAVAARLGHRYEVPVLITEHAPWVPWMVAEPVVRAQAVRASRKAAFHIAGSRFVRATIAQFTGDSDRLRTIPIGVDGQLFVPPPDESARDPDQILYVGRIHSIKGVDVLLRAMRVLVERRPSTRLTLVGGGFIYRGYQRQEEALRRLASELRLDGHIEFVGGRPPKEVAAWMQRSAVLVLPSRAEAFGAVLVEALACGTPVVATRCGGPEDVVADRVGRLVPSDDEEALAGAIEDVLANRDRYDPGQLRAYALEGFSWDTIARRTLALYEAAINGEVR
jgi:teichuronic acid biosynthesis glycosyltransferase TuaC